ncbi:hypothetical protein AB0L97_35975 [Nocardia sp. NPDC051911]|uniref:hypothetical protein n=1 Tax=unclassified Nocardia TaxID=2637762 RepID=UPI00342F5418
MTQQPPQHPASPNPARRRVNTLLLAVGGAVLATIVLIVLVGVVLSVGEPTAAISTRSEAVSASARTDQPAPRHAPTSPFGPSDARCAPAATGVVELVQPGLTRTGWRIINGTVISVGGTTYFGASIIDQGGAVKDRSDVWVVRGGKVYASTSGARDNTTFPTASAAPLNIAPGDELVQAVDRCVVNITLGR